MKILVTGSNGFVGSRLMWYLEEKKHDVHGIDKRELCLSKRHDKTLIGDIRNIEDLNKLDKNFDLIIHCAADKHDFGISKDSYYSNNEYGTQVLAEWAASSKIDKMIYYSTVSIYGHEAVPCDESGPHKPDNDYGASKLAGEVVLEKWHKADETRALIILRPSIIYGTHNFANMYNLIDMMHRKPWITIGNGSHKKSMVALENLVDMTYFMFDHLKPGIQYFNTLDKPYYTVHELMESIAKNKGFSMPIIKFPLQFAISIGKCFDLLAKLTGIDIPINSDRMRKFAISTEYYSEKIRKLGYKQQHTIDKEIARTCEWYLKNWKRRAELDPTWKVKK
jgi:nucleoside-diphosphate-sugar epimerase